MSCLAVFLGVLVAQVQVPGRCLIHTHNYVVGAFIGARAEPSCTWYVGVCLRVPFRFYKNLWMQFVRVLFCVSDCGTPMIACTVPSRDSGSTWLAAGIEKRLKLTRALHRFFRSYARRDPLR